MQRFSRGALSALFLAVPLALAGCNAGSQPASPCPAISGVFSQGSLVSPASGATGVPTTVGRVSFTVSNPDLQGPQAVVTFAGRPPGNATGGDYFTMNPGTVTTASNGVSSVGPVPTLQPGLTYAVSVGAQPAIPGTNCRGAVGATLGSFST